ncbi:hypothetical protein CHUAL_005186 [Chamberlinius hualienensis]
MHWKSNRRSAGNGASTSADVAPSISSSSTTTDDEPSSSGGSSDSIPQALSPLSDGGASLLNMIKWSDESQYLKEFLQKHQTLPQVARIIKGQYLTLGVSNSLSSSSSLHQTIFLCSKAKRLKVAAQCVKFKEGKKVVPVGPRLAIPDNYEGWFEILSEEGKAVRCIESVAELARRFPDSCLVRENVKAYVAKGDELEIITDRVRTISAGETLVLLSEVLGTNAISADKNSNNVDHRNGANNKGRFLRCFDTKGENVYLSFDQRGKFSLVAKEDNISGVHSIKNLLTKRFPLMVRLVTGKTPLGGKIGSNFVPEMRLYASFEEECVMALPLQSSPSNPKSNSNQLVQPSTIVAVPISVPLKLQGSRNPELLPTFKEYSRLQDEYKSLIEEAADRIQVFDMDSASAKDQAKTEVALYRKLPYFRRAFSDPNGYRLYRHPRSLSSTDLDQQHSESDIKMLSKSNSGVNNVDECDDRYNEIDQIYDYVRGFAPLPKSADVDAGNESGAADDDDEDDGENKDFSEGKSSPEESIKPPDPPPIETIPARTQRNVTAVAHTVHPVRVVQVTSNNKRPSIENHYERIPRVGLGSGAGGRLYSKDSRLGGSKLGKIYAIKSSANGVHHRHSSSNGHKTSSAKLFRQHQRVAGHNSSSSSNDLQQRLYEHPAVGLRGSVKSSATSPIFNIRYKSLTNLTSLEFNTLDSSNSGGALTSNGSSYIIEECQAGVGGSGQKGHKKQLLNLGRPKSLTSLGLLHCSKDNRNYQFHHQFNLHKQQQQQPTIHLQQRQLNLHDNNRANLLNSVICRQPSKSKDQKEKNIFINGSGNSITNSNSSNSLKRIGTLYL